MNRVLAFTIEQIMAPCRVYAADFPGGIPPGKDGRGANKIKAVARAKINPSSAAHAAAHAAKAKTYTEEKPCKKCGGFLRYTAGRQCVVCHRIAARVSARACYVAKHGDQVLRHREMRAAAEASRKAAEAAGEMLYHQAVPCVRCSSTVRYVKNNRCKRCADAYQAKLTRQRSF